LKQARPYYESASYFFAHAYYEPHLPPDQQNWGGLRWASLPRIPVPHCSGKIAVVGQTPQKSGEILDLGFLKCIDTGCGFGGPLTALDVSSGKLYDAR
jgi:serine/threonine protein phosphatase 1